MIKKVLPNFLPPLGVPLSVYHQINTYRVLLIRARQSMVICDPEGNPEDTTRLLSFYDGTYQYLKQIGSEELLDSC